ncbi:MAG: restriction endonuclease subunit S [Limnochordia bacterium]|nr:restriction endonuclease subunit S [Limnochordia bacterium]
MTEIMEIIGGGTPNTKVAEYWNGDIPWISVKDFNNNQRYVYHTARSITHLGLQNSSTKLLEKGDLIISARGTVGQVAQLGKSMAFNQTSYGLRAKPEMTTNDFLYYLLLNMNEIIRGNTHGTVFDTITRETFNVLRATLPPLPIQKAIAGTLSCLDAKIEVNNKIIRNLEEQAQAIFKNCFVDFEPFQEGEFVESELGAIPKGWCVKSLDEIADFTNGLAMQRYRPQIGESSLPVVKIKELRQRFTDENSDRCSKNIDANSIISNGDIIFSWSGSLLVDVWTGGKAGLNQHLFKVTSDQYPSWFYFQWTKFHLGEFLDIAASRATTMGHIKRSHLSDAKVLVPTKRQIQEIGGIMEPILSAKITRRIENQTLATLRDTLLPKLMSGEIEVPIDQ